MSGSPVARWGFRPQWNLFRLNAFTFLLLLASSPLLLLSGHFNQALASATDPIVLLGQLDPDPGTVYADVWGEGDYAYMGVHGGTGVYIIDISDPTNPSLATTYSPSSGLFQDVKVYDGIGYFATSDGDGTHIVDLSTPTTPVLLAKIQGPGVNWIHNLSKAGDYLYLVVGNIPKIEVYDMSSPASPVFVRTINTPIFGALNGIHDITAIGTRLYASDIVSVVNGTLIYDTSSIGTSAPTLLGNALAEGPTSRFAHSNWASSDGAILVTAEEVPDGKVHIFNISNPASPVLLSTMDRTSLGIDADSPHNPVLFDDTLLFVSWYEAGVIAIDISDPSKPGKGRRVRHLPRWGERL